MMLNPVAKVFIHQNTCETTQVTLKNALVAQGRSEKDADTICQAVASVANSLGDELKFRELSAMNSAILNFFRNDFGKLTTLNLGSTLTEILQKK